MRANFQIVFENGGSSSNDFEKPYWFSNFFENDSCFQSRFEKDRHMCAPKICFQAKSARIEPDLTRAGSSMQLSIKAPN